jgi:hypothetical protein
VRLSDLGSAERRKLEGVKAVLRGVVIGAPWWKVQS